MIHHSWPQNLVLQLIEALPPTQEAEASEYPTGKIRWKKVANRRQKRENKTTSTASSKERSWVWDHFIKVDHLIMDIIDGKEGTPKEHNISIVLLILLAILI